MRKILHVMGARPNFMKIAPVMGTFDAAGGLDQSFILASHRYDEKMAEIFFRDLGLPRPDRDLDAGSESHAEQTVVVLIRFGEVLEEMRPDLVGVVGDVNSTLAASGA